MQSKNIKQIITCPKCGKQHTMTVWTSLNSKTNPTENKQLIDGMLYRHKCLKCGYEVNIEIPSIYYNKKSETMIAAIFPNQVFTGISMLNAAIKEETMFKPSLKIRRRVVSCRNELTEKALIFESGLDDRLVELVKFHTVQSLGPGKDIEYMYFSIKNGIYMIETKVNGKIMEAEVNDAYKEVTDAYKHLLYEEDTDVIVHAGWAREFVKKNTQK